MAFSAPFSGFGRAIQPYQKSPRGLSPSFHVLSSLLPMPWKVSKDTANETKNLFQIRQEF